MSVVLLFHPECGSVSLTEFYNSHKKNKNKIKNKNSVLVCHFLAGKIKYTKNQFQIQNNKTNRIKTKIENFKCVILLI